MQFLNVMAKKRNNPEPEALAAIPMTKKRTFKKNGTMNVYHFTPEEVAKLEAAGKLAGYAEIYPSAAVTSDDAIFLRKKTIKDESESSGENFEKPTDFADIGEV